MARINYSKVLAGVGVGALDEVFENLDKRAGRTVPFRKWGDWYRLVLALGGLAAYAADLFPREMEDVAEGVYVAATPLLVKTVSQLLQQGFATAMVGRPAIRALKPPAPATAPARKVPALSLDAF